MAQIGRDLSLATRADIKENGLDIINDVPRVLQSILKGTKNSDEVIKHAKEFTSNESSIEKTNNILKRIQILSEEMEFNRICILKSLSRSALACDALENINQSILLRTNSAK